MEKLQTMRTQFLAMMIGASLVTMFCIGAIFLEEMLSETEEKIEEVRTTLTADVEREIKIQTETAVSVIEGVYKRQQAGLLTEEQAKQEAAALVRDLRYDDGAGYFWIDTYEGVNVVLLGRKETEGKSRIGLTDPTGKQFIKEMIENGKKPGGGYTDLMFAKPNQSEPLPKRNYTASFAPYQWVIGTGIWIDYIDNRVAEMREKSDEQLRSSIITMIVVMVILQAIIIVFAVFFSNRMVTPIRKVTEVLEVLGTGDFRKSDKKNDNFPP